MKFIHTSDWHLGQSLRGLDRSEEQRAMLSQLAVEIRDRQPDLLVVAGDIFDVAAPAATAQRLFASAVREFRAAAPGMVIAAIAGNHDSGSRHEAFRPLLESLGIHMIGQIDRENPGSHIVSIEGKGFLVAVPYAFSRNIPEGFIDTLMSRVAELNTSAAGGKPLPVVMVAHVTVAGADFTGHDRVLPDSVGNVEAVPISYFGTGYDYLALGHIHRPQTIEGSRQRAFYSGSPLPVGFDEAYPHFFMSVEISEHGADPVVEMIEVRNPHPLVTLPSPGKSVPFEEAIALLKNFDDAIPAYIRLNVEVELYGSADWLHQAEVAAEGKACRVLAVNCVRKADETVNDRDTALTVEQLQTMEPSDVMDRYMESRGLEFDEDLRELFGEALAQTREDMRE